MIKSIYIHNLALLYYHDRVDYKEGGMMVNETKCPYTFAFNHVAFRILISCKISEYIRRARSHRSSGHTNRKAMTDRMRIRANW